MQVSFGIFSKRRNSTKQPSGLSDTRKVSLKKPTSLDAPVFEITGDNFNYNYAQDGSNYYFIDDIVSLHNGMSEVHCILDVLATYKAYILASTQFVTYSNHKSSIWLPDTRVPITQETITRAKAVVNPEFSKIGSYVLAVNGQNGCELYRISRSDISNILQNITQWQSDAIDAFLDNLIAPGGDIVQATENMYTVIARAGAFGNAYSDAPNCLRSCIWVPFSAAAFDVVQANKRVYLGQFDTFVNADAISAMPHSSDYDVSIDWYYNDWRRSACEEIYMYLPLVGLVSLNASNITDQSNIHIQYSLSPTDGAVGYEIAAGGQIIGAYGATCSASFPLGISQQASSGELINSIISGGEKMINSAINSSISPVSTAGAGVGVAFQGAVATYNTVQVANSRHNSCIGGIGGGVGAGLDLIGTLYHVIHPTLINPDAMMQTMGVPTMQPLVLSGLSGYCQCANAHVEAPAPATALDAIDTYLNSGFYIE